MMTCKWGLGFRAHAGGEDARPGVLDGHAAAGHEVHLHHSTGVHVGRWLGTLRFVPGEHLHLPTGAGRHSDRRKRVPKQVVVEGRQGRVSAGEGHSTHTRAGSAAPSTAVATAGSEALHTATRVPESSASSTSASTPGRASNPPAPTASRNLRIPSSDTASLQRGFSPLPNVLARRGERRGRLAREASAHTSSSRAELLASSPANGPSPPSSSSEKYHHSLWRVPPTSSRVE
mmetsp:Transcript_49826/g.159247  ORF Transcript_49826/g.159247 Transcript_49826/m.159247 type:complete len:232 (-) Transcript_49826:443-1138(-)